MAKTPIALVQMPYADLERPSLALGLLQASLQEAGIPAVTVHGNLRFAERIGLARIRQLRQLPEHFLAGEWTFSRAAFPESQEPPGFLEALERRCGYAVDLQELRPLAEAFTDELARELVEKGYPLVGCTSTFQQHCASLALLRRVKELAPETVTVLGGANCEGEMGLEAVRAFPWLDIVVSGEADLLIAELVRLALRGEMDQLPYGAITRERLAGGAPRVKVSQLDALPYPRFEEYFASLEQSSFATSVQPGLALEGSRGCWWGQKHHCTFCGLNGSGMGYRAKSGGRLGAEIEALVNRHGVSRISMVDNILDPKAFEDLLPQLAQRSAPVSLFYEVKANLSRNQLETLRDAGVRWVQPGLESLSDEVLTLMDKGTTGLQNIRFLRLAREFGIRVTWLCLTGVPGEKDEWYQEIAGWLPWIAHLQPPTRSVKMRYDRFSPYHQRPEQYGLSLVPDHAYRYIYPGDVNLDRLAYFFEDAPESTPPGRESAEHRPGLSAMESQVMRWANSFWRWPEMLCMTDDGERVRIFDTRQVRLERDCWLEGMEREALLACETPRKTSYLVKKLGPSVEPALVELQRRRLVLHLNERWLALPVPGSVPRLPARTDFPGGSLRL